jgi:uncharacterized coiled-coil protein SlyX
MSQTARITRIEKRQTQTEHAFKQILPNYLSRLRELESLVRFQGRLIEEINDTLCHLTEPVWELERKKATKKP